MHRGALFLTFILAGLIIASGARARDHVHIVGSSTVFPFVSVASEKFGESTEFKTPIVEATGTGGGFDIFCSGLGNDTPDFSNASRKIKMSEVAQCADSGVTEITELKIGYDGIILANAIGSTEYDLTKQQLFLALAQEVPAGSGTLVKNPYKRWNEIDSALPDKPILVFGPPETSGTRDTFTEIVMEKACNSFPEYAEQYPDSKKRIEECRHIREDGLFSDVGENDNVIVQKLTTTPDAIGLFGYSFLEQNGTLIKANKVNGVLPTIENISTGLYAVARSLYIYAKTAHADTIPGMKEFAVEITSDEAVGPDGYLMEKGLIPLPPGQHEVNKRVALTLAPLNPN